MVSPTQRDRHRDMLLEITGLPTAAGREHRVLEWVTDWVRRRKNLRLRSDKAGNLIINHIDAPSPRAQPLPIYIEAHMDHPNFVVKTPPRPGETTLTLEFRGGVNNPYFDNARIDIFDADDTVYTAKITKLDAKAKPFKLITADLRRATDALQPGDVGRFAFRGRGRTPTIHNGRLYTPACDDLAGVAAALSALDVLRNRKTTRHVGVLLTRAEEIGFIGTLAVCKDKSLPRSSRLICLETSRSFVDSPIGAGPILRVGDKISVFDPRLTNRIGLIMTEHAKRQQSRGRNFRWQRKLMPGGACEATAFSVFGYESTCLCLALGNYHNMRDIDGVAAGKRPAKVAPEEISVDDYHGLVEMLIITCRELDEPRVESLEAKMHGWLEQFKDVVYAP